MEREKLLTLKTKYCSQLLYNINKDLLRNFVSDRVNVFLVEYFYENNGLEITDPFQKKTECRV